MTNGMAEVDPSISVDTTILPKAIGFKRVNGSIRVTYYQRADGVDTHKLAPALTDMSIGRFYIVFIKTLEARHFVDHPAVGALVIETAPPLIFPGSGGKGADWRGMQDYPALVEEMAAFLVAVGPGFQSGMVIPEAHQLDVYPVVAQLLNLETPSNIAISGGALRCESYRCCLLASNVDFEACTNPRS